MKNKIIIAIVIILLLAVVGIVTIQIMNENKIFTNCTIQTYDGVEISDYKQNKRAFTIMANAQNAVIKVNGQEVQNESSFYEIGEYNIEVTANGKTEKKQVNILQLEPENRSEYNIIYNAPTLPILFASMNMASNTDIPTYLWYGRQDTLNEEEIKNTFSDIYISQYIGETSVSDGFMKIIPELKQYVQEVLKKDENAYFHFYVDEYRYYVEFKVFAELGLTEDKYDVTLVSDGTLSYVADYGIMKEDTQSLFEQEKEDYERILNDVRSNKYSQDVECQYLLTKEDDSTEKIYSDYDLNYMLISTLRDNVKYNLQYPELLVFKDETVKTQMENANLIKTDANAQFNKLSEQEKELFFKYINLDKKTLDEEYFNEQEDKKYLIITGARPFYGEYTETEFKNMLEQVYEKYKDEYVILYKPHPSALPNNVQTAYLESMDIKILPGKLPMEAICFIYDDLKLGGFGSSLYMSAKEDSTLFFFIDDKENLVEPLNVLYDKLFQNAECIKS